jgi:hypothetical protein
LAVVALVAISGRFFRLPLLPISPQEALPQHSAMLLSFQPEQLGGVGTGEKGPNIAAMFLPQQLGLDLAKFRELLLEIRLGTVWAAVQPTRSSGMDVLFVADVGMGLDAQKLLSKKKGWRVRTSIFKNNEVLSVDANGQKFALAKFRNLLLLARHAYLVENGISQLKSPSTSFCHDAAFKKIARHSKGPADKLNLFFNLKNFNAQFAPLINPAKLLALEGLEKVGSWAAFQLSPNPVDDEWTGALIAASENVLLSANQGAGKRDFKDALRALPDNLTFFNWLAVKNIRPATKSGDWNKYFSPWVGNEAVLALGEPLENDEAEHFILLKSNKAEKAEKAIEAYAKSAGNLENYDFQMFKVRRLLGTDVSEMLGLGKRMPNPYLAVLGEYVLFSNSKAGLERWLGKYLAGQTLSKNVGFLQSLRRLPAEASGFLFFESAKLWQQLSQLPDENLLPALGGNPFHFGQLVATMQRNGPLCEFNFSVASAVPADEEATASILWKVALGGRVVGAPVVFQNPQNGELEIFVRDENNQLYLLSRSGRLLWRRQLEEPILSEIVQVDLNNNKEGQFVFSTASGIYVLDRQGNDLAGFPLKLQTSASNGVRVIDFFNSHDYQFFIACENGHIYGFDENGSPVEGWRPKTDVGHVRQPLFHFQSSGKDFMVVLDTAGRMQVFQKNGDLRFPEKKLESLFLQMPDFQENKHNARLVACDDKGKVFVFNLGGEYFGLHLKVGENQGVRFLFADVTGDERNDYIGASGADVAAYFYEKNEFKKKFDYQFPAPVDGLFKVKWQKTKKEFIGAFCENRRQIYLLDGAGRLLPQFPLEGTTAFQIADLLADGVPVALVGNEESVVAYRLE